MVLLTMAGVLWHLRANRFPTLGEITDGLRSDRVNLNISNSWAGEVQTMTTTWTDAHQNQHTVTTTKTEEETQTQFAERHKAAVEALQAVYPPA